MIPGDGLVIIGGADGSTVADCNGIGSDAATVIVRE